ncbi:MAG: tyrosine-protein phosphatase [Bacilli bacterium]|nr:tyrosine-protein phosphatase [Bacilli bacterium]
MQKRKMFLSFAFLSTLILSSCTVVANSSQESKQPSSPIESTSIPASSDSESSAPASSESSKPSSSNSSKSSSSSSSKSSSSSSSSKPSSSSSSTSEPPVSEGNFSNITEFNTPVEIHTADQKTYLSYSGNYDQMPENQYPDGSQHRSDSLPVNLSWNYSAPSGKTVSNYSFISGQKEDLSDGYEIKTSNKSVAYYNPYLGRNYYKLVANFSDGQKESTAVRFFDVDTTYPRNLTIGGMTNCRDMGGRILEDGGKMKQGLVYRTSGYKYDYSTTITEEGKKEMLQHLKVKTEVNVADGTSYNLKLSGTTVKDFKMDYSGGSHHFSRNAESVKNFFNLLGDSNNYPVYFHCRIGTDRTGLCAILLSGLLGVSLNEIYQDYLFSNFGKIGEKRYIGTKAGADNIQNYISDIQNMSGKTFKNKVYNMLLAIGVSKTTLDTVIANLTEGQTAKDNDAGQIIAPAKSLTASGTSLKTDTSDRDNPDNYYTLNSSSQSVSYSFSASKTYKGQVVAYLGNGDSSTSKKIADAIGCSLDNASISMKDQTYSDARMGKCSSRLNYYPVILGEVDIPAGNHTIKITGTSNSMNIGGLYIFDASTASGGGSQGGGEGGEHTTHNYVAQTPVTNKAGKQVTTYLCDCGKKYIAIKFTDYSSIDGEIGSDGKIGGTNKVKTTFKWDIPAKAGEVKLQFNVKMSNGADSHKNHVFDSSLYSVKINGVTQSILLTNGQTYGQLGLTTSGQYFDIASYSVDNDTNLEIEFVHNNSDYRLLFTEQVRLVY